MADKKHLLIGASGASGIPLLVRCLEIIREKEDVSTSLIMTDAAFVTLEKESDLSMAGVEALADHVYKSDNLAAPCASGTFPSDGMLVVPCSMKTASGIRCGYSDNLLLRAADVTIKEKRPLVLAAREAPLSPVHLRNLYDLSMLPNVWIIPPVVPYYIRPQSVQDVTTQIAFRLLSPFGIRDEACFVWNG